LVKQHLFGENLSALGRLPATKIMHMIIWG